MHLFRVPMGRESPASETFATFALVCRRSFQTVASVPKWGAQHHEVQQPGAIRRRVAWHVSISLACIGSRQLCQLFGLSLLPRLFQHGQARHGSRHR